MQQRQSVFCVLFPQSEPLIGDEKGEGGRGGGVSVDLGCTKGALILSREPTQSTEKHVQKEISLSSMPIEPPQWTPQIKPWRESKARMWEIRGGGVPIISNRPRFCHSPEGVITLVSEPPSCPAWQLPPITEECPFTQSTSIIPETEKMGLFLTAN